MLPIVAAAERGDDGQHGRGAHAKQPRRCTSAAAKQKRSGQDAFVGETLHAEFPPAENLDGGAATHSRGAVLRGEGVADVGEARGGARPSPRRGALLGGTGEASGGGNFSLGTLGRVHGHGMDRSRVASRDRTRLQVLESSGYFVGLRAPLSIVCRACSALCAM